MVETPELQVVLDVHQCLAHLVFAPVLAAVLVDARERRDDGLVLVALLAEITAERAAGHGQADARQMHEQLVIDARRLQRLEEPRVPFGLVLVDGQQGAALVAQYELQDPVLRRLEAGRLAEHMPELRVFAGGQRVEHLPLVVKLALDLARARQHFQCRRQRVFADQAHGTPEFVQQQLHPQLRDLVLDDEQHLVVVRRVAERLLRGEQGI